MTGEAAARTRGKGAANLVCFHVAGRQFGCPIQSVKETLALRPLTRVFLTPSWIAGIMNLRGDVVAVVDLAAFLGLGRTPIASATRIVLARGGEKTAGFLVDRLADPRAVDLAALEPLPPTLDPEIASLLAGVVTIAGGEPLAILDLAAILRSPRMRVRQTE